MRDEQYLRYKYAVASGFLSLLFTPFTRNIKVEMQGRTVPSFDSVFDRHVADINHQVSPSFVNLRVSTTQTSDITR